MFKNITSVRSGFSIMTNDALSHYSLVVLPLFTNITKTEQKTTGHKKARTIGPGSKYQQIFYLLDCTVDKECRCKRYNSVKLREYRKNKGITKNIVAGTNGSNTICTNLSLANSREQTNHT